MNRPFVRKPWWRRWFGDRSERAASRYLKGLGYRILVRNYACRLGEIDLIAADGGCIVFVEVRSTADASSDGPAASVDHEKQRRLTQAATVFLQQHRLLGRAARFDVVAVSWPEHAREPRIEHTQHAFACAGASGMFS
jgi:putative endonuclease